MLLRSGTSAEGEAPEGILRRNAPDSTGSTSPRQCHTPAGSRVGRFSEPSVLPEFRTREFPPILPRSLFSIRTHCRTGFTLVNIVYYSVQGNSPRLFLSPPPVPRDMTPLRVSLGAPGSQGPSDLPFRRDGPHRPEPVLGLRLQGLRPLSPTPPAFRRPLTATMLCFDVNSLRHTWDPEESLLHLLPAAWVVIDKRYFSMGFESIELFGIKCLNKK